MPHYVHPQQSSDNVLRNLVSSRLMDMDKFLFRRRMATSRDYTSITDELELQISTPIQERATSPAPSQPLQVIETSDDMELFLLHKEYLFMRSCFVPLQINDSSKSSSTFTTHLIPDFMDPCLVCL